MPEDLYYSNDTRISFTRSFKYLRSIITPELNEDAETGTQIKKAKSIMGITKTFFNCHDVEKLVIYEVYTSGPLNALLCGCESWRFTQNNKRKLKAFDYTAIRKSLASNGTKSESIALKM